MVKFTCKSDDVLGAVQRDLVAKEVGEPDPIKLLSQDITLVGQSTCFVAPIEPA